MLPIDNSGQGIAVASMKSAPVLLPHIYRQAAATLHQVIAHRCNTSIIRKHQMGPFRIDSLACQGYVGQQTPLAGEYHCRDFEFQDHAQTTAHLIEQQWDAAPAAVRAAAELSSTGVPLTAVAQLLATLWAQAAAPTTATEGGSSAPNASRCDGGREGSSSSTTTITTIIGSMNNNSSSQLENNALQLQQQQQHCVQNIDIAALQQQISTSSLMSSAGSQQPFEHINPPPALQAVDGLAAGHAWALSATEASGISAAAHAGAAAENKWEVFYRAHPSAKFFKERRYLLLEFPCLAPPAIVQHIVEIGAGCGSSILPVLRAQPQARATVCDVSPTCLQQLSEALQLLGLGPERCRSFVADGTDPMLGLQLQDCNADVALIMFTLSAVVPEGMLVMMRNAAASLRPGGLLCIRDHALYDMVQLRIPAEQTIGRHLYKRGDGTLAYFYTVQDLSGLAVAAGLDVVECQYVCVVNKNRKTGLQLRRTFVHGMFRKPLAHA